MKPNSTRLHAELDAGLKPFSSGLCPVAGLAKKLGYVDARGELRILAFLLFNHQHFTSTLENGVVMPAAFNIAVRGEASARPPLRKSMADLYEEEGKHLNYATCLSIEVGRFMSLEFDFNSEAQFFRDYARFIATAPASISKIARSIVAVGTETLISATLGSAPDPSVLTDVTNTLTDHAEDEKKHASLYGAYWKHLLPEMSEVTLVDAATLLARTVKAFLTPDIAAIHRTLVGEGLEVSQADEVIHLAYGGGKLAALIKDGARPTTKLLMDTAVLSNLRIAEIYRDLELI